MRLNLLIIAGLLAAALGGAWFLDQRAQPNVMTIEPAQDMHQKAPNIAFADMSGTERSLMDWKGRGIVLNFWASWCAPCVVEMPALLDIARNNPDDIVLLLVSVDAEAKAIHTFFDKHGFELPANTVLVHDEFKRISKDNFGTIRYPETILIDRDGDMVKKIPGAIDWHDANAQKLITDLLQ